MADGRYVTLSTFKAYVRSEETSSAAYEAALLAGEQEVDNLLGRRMQVVTAGAPGLSTRVFRPGPAGEVVMIHDCTEVTAVTENGTAVDSSAYQLEPLNGLSAGGESVPYDRIRRLNGGCWYSDGDRATVSVTARWGWAAIPYQVVEMCKIVSKAILEGRDIKHGLVALAESGGVSEREAKIVKDAVHHYRSVGTWGLF